MTVRPERHLIAAIAVMGVSAKGCLPADTRPPPAEVRFVAAPGDDPAGVMTSDGWLVTTERLLVGIGDGALEYPCERYSESHYFRLLDGTRPGDQKINTAYGLGQCHFSFRVVWPDDAALLGEGVRQDDLVHMSTPQPLPGNTARAGIGVEWAGTATKDSVTKHFTWSFRQATTYSECRMNGSTTPFEWKSAEGIDMRVFLSGSAILANDTGDNPPLVFAPIAAADDTFGDQDGEVTLEEIDAVAIAEARRYGRYRLGQATGVRTLRDYLFLQTLGNVASVRDGFVCAPQLGIRDTR